MLINTYLIIKCYHVRPTLTGSGFYVHPRSRSDKRKCYTC
jgi:hypothetical protein